MASDQRMRIILDAVDNASATLKGVNSEVTSLQSVMTTGVLGLSAAALAKGTVDLALYGNQVNRLRDSFERLAGTNADATLERLREAARGSIADMSLMQSANKAMMLGVTRDAETMAQLVEVSAARGRAMGLSAEQAFNDIITGIGRMSPLILDNLGIVTGGERAFAAYAESIGKTAAELTEAEKKQFLVNKVLAETPQLALDSAGKIESLTSAYKNFVDAVGAELSAGTGEAGGVFAPLIQGAADLINAYHANTEAEGIFVDALKEQRDEMEMTTVEYLKMIGQAAILNFQTIANGGSASDYAVALLDVNQQAGAAAVAHAGLQEELRYTQGELMATALAANEEAKALAAASRAAYIARVGPSSMYAWTENTEMLRTWERGREKSNTVLNPNRDWLIQEPRGSTRSALSEAERSMNEYQRSLQSLAESILTPSAVSEADMLRTRLGTYEGYWDEYVRRLQSAATDSNSAWRHMIPGDVLAQGADAMKLWVEQEKQAFYAGQRLESVDWDAFTKAAEEEQSRRAAREALVAEGVRRLGGTMTQSEVAGLLGVGTTGQDSGAAYVEQFTAGAAGADVGGQLTATIDAQFRANEPEWMAMGRLTMGFFLKGAQESVNGDMVRGLWNALLPHMGDWMARQGGKP